MHGAFDAQRILTILTAPRTLIAMAAMVALIAAIAWASRRTLCRQPDFPHKGEMLWGARWAWALMAAFLAVFWVVAYVGAALTSHAGAVLVGAAVLLMALPLLTLHPLYWQWVGAGYCAEPWWAKVRGKRFDVFEAVEETERTRRQWEIGIACLNVVAIVFVGIIGWLRVSGR